MQIETNNIEPNLLRSIRLHRYQTITNVILIIVLILIGLYIFWNLEEFKPLGGDICKMCVEKTGAVCAKIYG